MKINGLIEIIRSFIKNVDIPPVSSSPSSVPAKDYVLLFKKQSKENTSAVLSATRF